LCARGDPAQAERHRPVWIGAIITSACVAAGVVLATMTLPAVPTPARVARTYAEARFASDWPQAWALLCETVRSAIDYPTFAERADHANEYFGMPSDVDIEIGDVRGVQGPNGPAASVAITATSGERRREHWVYRGEVLLVEEGGEFRVCQKDDMRRDPLSSAHRGCVDCRGA
jgi:hypothetical protein